jgi:hypothetical protein
MIDASWPRTSLIRQAPAQTDRVCVDALLDIERLARRFDQLRHLRASSHPARRVGEDLFQPMAHRFSQRRRPRFR